MRTSLRTCFSVLKKQNSLASKKKAYISTSSHRFLSNSSNKPATAEKRNSKRLGPVSWTSLAIAAATGVGLVSYFYFEKDRRKTVALDKQKKQIGKPQLGGPWTLVDHTGRPYTDKHMRENGHGYALLYFGFTFCPDICPAELIKMKRIIEKLDKKVGEIVLPVFISVDPKRDGVAQVAHYIKDFHPRTVGLTGTPEQVGVACKAFRVYYNIADQDEELEDDYLVDHSIVMYLIGPDGTFLDFYTQLTEVDEAVQRIEKIIKEA
eukprot:maker-scaffold_15-snap-gene-3.27-mRNA-1 protein AED:0.02 eAED:0.02 QI:85/1/1/1/1/1/2/50/263